VSYHNVDCFLNRIKTKYQTSYTLLRFSSILIFLVPGPVLPFQVISKQVTFYTVRYTVLGIFQSALHFTSWLTCSIHHHLDFTGKNPATLQLIRLLVVHNNPSLSIIRNWFKEFRELERSRMKVLAQVSASEHRILTVRLLINNVCYSMLSAWTALDVALNKIYVIIITNFLSTSWRIAKVSPSSIFLFRKVLLLHSFSIVLCLAFCHPYFEVRCMATSPRTVIFGHLVLTYRTHVNLVRPQF